MTSPWKRRRVWWFTRLDNGQWVWPGTVVEYQEITIDFCGWMLGNPLRFPHYRRVER